MIILSSFIFINPEAFLTDALGGIIIYVCPSFPALSSSQMSFINGISPGIEKNGNKN